MLKSLLKLTTCKINLLIFHSIKPTFSEAFPFSVNDNCIFLKFQMKNVSAVLYFSFSHSHPISEFYRLYLQNRSRMGASPTPPAATILVQVTVPLTRSRFSTCLLVFSLMPSSSFSTQQSKKSWLNVSQATTSLGYNLSKGFHWTESENQNPSYDLQDPTYSDPFLTPMSCNFILSLF